VLFIDARNIFTQIDRAHRELSDAQIQNIAIIPRLHKGRRGSSWRWWTATSAARPGATARGSRAHAGAERAPAAVLAEDATPRPSRRARMPSPACKRSGPACPAGRKPRPARRRTRPEAVDDRNTGPARAARPVHALLQGLHASLKALDKAIREMDKRKAEAAKAAGKRATGNRQTKGVKDALQALHDEVKLAESCLPAHRWLQERFPKAAYEDVTGLCKLATPRGDRSRTGRSIRGAMSAW
jgi:type I restriction enzyme M protein